MTENIKLENKLKTLETKDENELFAVKLTVAQAKMMLLEGNGETAYNKIFDSIIKTRNELQTSVNEQFKKTEMQKYKEQLKKYVDNICTTIDQLELYTYQYVDGAIEKQEEKMESVEERILELVIVKDELEKVKSLYEELNKQYQELDGRHNKVMDEKNNLEEENKNIESELAAKEDELSKKQEELTTVTNKLNDLLLSHKNEIDELTEKLKQEQEQRIESDKKAYEISLMESNYKTRIIEKDEEIKDYRNKINEQINNNQKLMEELRKEKDAKIEELYTKNSSLSLSVNNISDEKIKLEEVVRTQETKIENLKDEKNKLELENATLEDIKIKNEGKIREQEEAFKILEGSHKKEQEELKNEIEGLKVELKVKDAQNEKLEVEAKKVPGLESDIAIAKDKLESAIAEKEKFEQMYNDLMAKFTELATSKK